MLRRQWIAYAIALFCFAIIIARLIWPKLNFDGIALSLLAVAVTAALLPSVLPLLPPIKKLKLFQVEAEFERQIDALARSVVAAETNAPVTPVPGGTVSIESVSASVSQQVPTTTALTATNDHVGDADNEMALSQASAIPAGSSYPDRQLHGSGTESWQVYFDEYFKIVASAISAREKVLSVAILLERMLQNVVASLGLSSAQQGRVRSPREIVNLLKSHDLLSDAEANAFNEFWAVRNKVVHGEMAFVSEADAARILDLAWRLNAYSRKVLPRYDSLLRMPHRRNRSVVAA